MNYGYFNAFITNIGEEVPDKVEALQEKADEVIVDYLSSRPALNELIEKLTADDTIYICSFNRFASGIRDLDTLLTEIIDEIGANIVCLEEGFDFSTDEGKGARKAFAAAVPLINADPLTGFFK
ncbi:MAG: recombinase family protein [Eubacterium sp.]|nr:recombinase family protein [Eubacterium sp.]